MLKNKLLEFTLQKDDTVHDSEKPWWESFLNGQPKIDVDLIEGSKYLDVSLLRKVKAEKQRKKLEEDAKLKQGSSSSVPNDSPNNEASS